MMYPADQTWREWMPAGAPDPPLLSHVELLAELDAQGAPVTAATLESWRKGGIIPRPVRMYHNGNTRAVYPSWLVPAIVHLRELQAAGKSLQEILPVMRAHALNTVQSDAVYRDYCDLVLRIVHLRQAGKTIDAIAAEEQVTPERVRESLYRYDRAAAFMEKRQ